MNKSKLVSILLAVAIIAVVLTACIPSQYKNGVEMDNAYADDIVPIYDDSIIYDYENDDDEEFELSAGTEDDLDDVVDFYVEYFEQNNVKFIIETDDDDEFEVTGQSKGYSFELQIEEARGQYEEKVFTTCYHVEMTYDGLEMADVQGLGDGLVVNDTIEEQVSSQAATIETGEAVIGFEAEAFTSETTVTVTELIAEGESRSGLRSPLYRVEMDQACFKPVTIKIMMPEDATNENVSAGISTEVQAKSSGEQSTHFLLKEVTVEDGYAVINIDPDLMAELVEEEMKHKGFIFATAYAAASKFVFTVGLFDSEFYYSEGGHFKVMYNTAWVFGDNISRNAAMGFLNDAETAYEEYIKMGYTFGPTKWPYPIYIESLKKEAAAFDNSGWSELLYGKNPNNSWILLNRENFKKDQDYKDFKGPLFSSFAHELFHLVQMNYVKKSAGWGEEPSLWFDEATASWMEFRVGKVYPASVTNYRPMLFTEGLFPQTNTDRDGYGRVPLIEYLVNNHGEGMILNTYNEIKKGTKVNMAIMLHSAPPEDYVDDFFISLTSGGIGKVSTYDCYYKTVAKEAPYDQIGIAQDVSLPKDFKEQLEKNGEIELGKVNIPAMAPLSARVVALKFDEQFVFDMEDGYSLVVKANSSQPCSVHLFKVKRGKGASVQVVRGTNEASISNLETDMTDGCQYFALCIAKQLEGKADVSLDLSISAYPTLDELVGVWDTASMTIDDVFVSKELRDKLAQNEEEAQEALGCDFISEAAIASLEKEIGKTTPNFLKIEKTSENTGVLMIKDAPDEDFDEDNKYAFEYVNGSIISNNAGEEGVAITILLKARYAPDHKVTLNGTMEANFKDQIIITLVQKAEKPLPKKP